MLAEELLVKLSNLKSRTRDYVWNALQICVPIYSPGHAGGTPFVTPDSCQHGFDWDSGKVLLNVKENLMIVSDEAADVLYEYRQKTENKILKYIQTRSEIKKDVIVWLEENNVDDETIKKFKKEFRTTGKMS